MTTLTSPAPTTLTLTIPETRVVDLRVRMERLARKAEQFGQPAPTYTVGEPRLRTYVDEVTLGEASEIVVDVTVTAMIVGLSGWTLLAAVDLDPEGGPAIVRTVPGVDGDPAWHALPDFCDHCGRANAGRRTIVVLAHEDGRRAVVGRTCVRDYIGHDVAAAVWPLTWADAVEEAEREFTGLGRGEIAWPLDHFLAVTDAVIRAEGWVSRGEARNRGGDATADLVEMWLRRAGDPEAQAEILRDGLPEVPGTDLAAAIAWAAGQADADVDYLRNLAIVARRGYVTVQTAGLAASLLAGYARAEERRLQAAAEREAATPVIEGRIVITGTVLRIRHTDTEFGVVTKMTVRDDRGFTVNGTLPRALESGYDIATGVIPGAEVGARVEFTAAVTASPDKPWFGFYKRPTKAKLLAPAPAGEEA